MKLSITGILLLFSFALWGSIQKEISSMSAYAVSVDNRILSSVGSQGANKVEKKLEDKAADIDTFIQKLSGEQKLILETFFRDLIRNSFSGYVLYGDKPLCIEGFPLTYDSGAFPGPEENSPLYFKALELLRNINISPDNKEHFFLLFDVPNSEYMHLICINRRAFLQAVNENISLFRYVLGPAVTAENLLQELIDAKEEFYAVLKDDNVLLGILLGYGKQNALIVSRSECISDAFTYDREEDFPFLARQKRMHLTALPKMQKKKPSFGFTSLAEEKSALKKTTVVSCKLRPNKLCRIPYFGCEPESKETQTLLDTYEKNREVILKTCESKDFLRNTLTKLFQTNTGMLDIPSVPQDYLTVLPKDTSIIVKNLIRIVQEEIREETYFQKSFFEAFLKGIKAREKDLNISAAEAQWAPFPLVHDLEGCKNLAKARLYFQALSKEKDVTSLIPDKLYYRVLHTGKGDALSNRVNHVSFHFSFHLLDDKEIEAGTVKKENLQHIIPGISQCLIGMKRGGQREIYIHPEYGYGVETYLPFNATIIATIELVDFEEGKEEAIFSSPYRLEQKNFKELLAQYEKQRCDEYYINGIHFWNFLKQSNELVDFEIFEKYFLQSTKSSESFGDEKQRGKFLMDLYWHLQYQKSI